MLVAGRVSGNITCWLQGVTVFSFSLKRVKAIGK